MAALKVVVKECSTAAYLDGLMAETRVYWKDYSRADCWAADSAVQRAASMVVLWAGMMAVMREHGLAEH